MLTHGRDARMTCVRACVRAAVCSCRSLYPEEKVAMKDPAEALLEPGDWQQILKSPLYRNFT